MKTDDLWTLLIENQNIVFHTATGLPFTYTIKLGRNGTLTKELWVDRRGKSKSLTISTINKAYEKAAVMEYVERPKALGDLIGVSYIYGIFYSLGIIDVPEKFKKNMSR